MHCWHWLPFHKICKTETLRSRARFHSQSHIQTPSQRIVPGDTDEEALAAALSLSTGDFDWEPVRDILESAEVVDDLGSNGEILTAQDSAPSPLPTPENCTGMPHMDNNLAGGYILIPTYAVLDDKDAAVLKGNDETPVMYFAIQRDVRFPH